MTARTVPASPNFFAGQKLTGTVLNQVSTVQNFWADPPMFGMNQSAGQSVPNNTPTTITMDTPQWDTDSGRSGTTPFGYVIPAGMTGRWRFTWGVPWNANTTGSRKAMLYRNGAVQFTAVVDISNNTDVNAVGASRTVAVNAGDVMTIVALQTCGGPLTTQVDGTFAPHFEGCLVSLGNP